MHSAAHLEMGVGRVAAHKRNEARHEALLGRKALGVVCNQLRGGERTLVLQQRRDEVQERRDLRREGAHKCGSNDKLFITAIEKNAIE